MREHRSPKNFKSANLTYGSVHFPRLLPTSEDQFFASNEESINQSIERSVGSGQWAVGRWTGGQWGPAKTPLAVPRTSPHCSSTLTNSIDPRLIHPTDNRQPTTDNTRTPTDPFGRWTLDVGRLDHFVNSIDSIDATTLINLSIPISNFHISNFHISNYRLQ